MEDRIACDATKCVHNEQGQCHAAIVHVRGGATANGDRVRCGTYAYVRPAPHSTGEFLFEAGQDMSPPLEAGQQVRIACNATKCSYFDDYVCSAGHIHVTDPQYSERGNATCDTFHVG